MAAVLAAHPRLVAFVALVMAPLAGAALATLVPPHQATAQGQGINQATQTFQAAESTSEVAQRAPFTAPAPSPPVLSTPSPSPAEVLRRRAQAEVLRLTRLLRDVRLQQDAADPGTRPLWEAALSALIAGRAGHATVTGALHDAKAPLSPDRLGDLRRDLETAADDVRRGHALLAIARRHSGLPSTGVRPGTARSVPVLTGRIDPLDPFVPQVMTRSVTAIRQPTVPPHTPTRLTDRSLAPPTRVTSNEDLTTLDLTDRSTPDPRIVQSMGLVGSLMDRPSTLVTGPLALPTGDRDPFRVGGPADWEPALTPRTRPPTDPSVMVNPAFSGPPPTVSQPVPSAGREIAARAQDPRTTPRVWTRSPARPEASPTTTHAEPPLLPAVEGPATSAPVVSTPTPVPPPADRPTPPPRAPQMASGVTPANAPPPRATLSDPSPLADRGHASQPIPFQVQPATTGTGPDAPLARQFADIAAQVAVERARTAEILKRVGPVQADLTRRINDLRPGDDRLSRLLEVVGHINTSEADIQGAIAQYDALTRQLEWAQSLLTKGGQSGSQWSPRDASRQAIAASVQARQGVTGLKLALARFEEIMGLTGGGLRIRE